MRSYCQSRAIDLPDSIAWSARPAELHKKIIDAVHDLKPDTRRRLIRDWERVSELTDEVGRNSIIRAFRDCRGEVLEEFRRHESAYDRALWLFLSREGAFKRAEEIAFAKFYQGHKRYWNGFVVPPGLPLQRDEIRLARFVTGIRAVRYLDGSGDHVDIDLYEHEGSDVTQVSMYIADLRDVALEFEGPQLTSRERQLAREAAILYSSETGALDVIAPGGSAVRASLAALLIAHLLENDRPVERIVLRRYDLRSLRSRRTFPVDVEDRIHAVEVRGLRLEPRDGRGGRLLVEATPRQPLSLYQRLGEWIHGADAVPGEFDVVAAKMTVTFMAKGGSGAGRRLNFDIAEPNGCNLKDHTCRERLIAEKYLERWGLIAEAERDDRTISSMAAL